MLRILLGELHMKFTNGYWMTKPEYIVLFATEFVRAKRVGDALEVLCATRPIGHRGNVIDGATFTLRFSAPAQDVIRVTAEHHRGRENHGPDFPLLSEEVTPVVEETAERLIFRSGRASAAHPGKKLLRRDRAVPSLLCGIEPKPLAYTLVCGKGALGIVYEGTWKNRHACAWD